MLSINIFKQDPKELNTCPWGQSLHPGTSISLQAGLYLSLTLTHPRMEWFNVADFSASPGDEARGGAK